MSLKDRLRSKKEAKSASREKACEYNISIQKVSKAIEKINDPADLGNIVKEFAKFLNTLTSDNAQFTFSGNFDLGQKTLLNCLLANFTEDKKERIILEENTDEEPTEDSKLIKKRKSVRAKIKAALQEEDNQEIEEE